MTKSSTFSAARNPRQPRAGDGRAVPASGVSVTSGAAVPRIDLTALLARTDAGARASRPAVTGAVHAVPGRDGTARTVALSDGTRITFASAVTEAAD